MVDWKQDYLFSVYIKSTMSLSVPPLYTDNWNTKILSLVGSRETSICLASTQILPDIKSTVSTCPSLLFMLTIETHNYYHWKDHERVFVLYLHHSCQIPKALFLSVSLSSIQTDKWNITGWILRDGSAASSLGKTWEDTLKMIKNDLFLSTENITKGKKKYFSNLRHCVAERKTGKQVQQRWEN